MTTTGACRDRGTNITVLHRLVAIGATWILLTGIAHAVLSVNEPWVRVAPDGRSAEVFVRLKSSDAARLVAVDSFAARRIEMRDGRRLARTIALPADVLVELRPGGLRLQMTGLTRHLKLGEHVPLTLIVTSADGLRQTIYVNAEVRHRSPSEDEMNPRGPNVHRH